MCLCNEITQALLAARHAGILLTWVGLRVEFPGVRNVVLRGQSGPDCEARERPGSWRLQAGDNEPFARVEDCSQWSGASVTVCGAENTDRSQTTFLIGKKLMGQGAWGWGWGRQSRGFWRSNNLPTLWFSALCQCAGPPLIVWHYWTQIVFPGPFVRTPTPALTSYLLESHLWNNHHMPGILLRILYKLAHEPHESLVAPGSHVLPPGLTFLAKVSKWILYQNRLMIMLVPGNLDLSLLFLFCALWSHEQRR